MCNEFLVKVIIVSRYGFVLSILYTSFVLQAKSLTELLVLLLIIIMHVYYTYYNNKSKFHTKHICCLLLSYLCILSGHWNWFGLTETKMRPDFAPNNTYECATGSDNGERVKNQPEGEPTLLTLAIWKQVFEETNLRERGTTSVTHADKAAPALGSSCR